MITPRLRAIINYISCRTAADIGTDHAYVPIELINSGRAERVIASDVREGPLGSARENIRSHGLSDCIETRLGSGLEPLFPREAEDIIIAGMGGKLICELLSASDITARQSRLILQPMNSQYELRKFLIENNYTILSEDIALEGFKVYNILEVRNGQSEPFETDFEYQLPKYLVGHKYFKELYEKKLREFSKITEGLEKSGDTHSEKYKKYRYFSEEARKYEG